MDAGPSWPAAPPRTGGLASCLARRRDRDVERAGVGRQISPLEIILTLFKYDEGVLSRKMGEMYKENVLSRRTSSVFKKFNFKAGSGPVPRTGRSEANVVTPAFELSWEDV